MVAITDVVAEESNTQVLNESQGACAAVAEHTSADAGDAIPETPAKLVAALVAAAEAEPAIVDVTPVKDEPSITLAAEEKAAEPTSAAPPSPAASEKSGSRVKRPSPDASEGESKLAKAEDTSKDEGVEN